MRGRAGRRDTQSQTSGAESVDRAGGGRRGRARGGTPGLVSQLDH
jgi:hypothetical protein